ncbi:hypothetical protein ABNB59_00480 [Paenibacillus larvae]|uniref:DNA-3-methyladenine glycosylase n=3 Tax=Paenibacillus larvae TaxID=1464 RepID=A0A2L1U0J7_9BACL|nr:hypothetical protein [Paenibacillus larvae]AQR76955.1 hypothetical protein BXP28_05845 [Paenibacillus larvae subsp. larvae]AQT83317.1 hypothetical protein B1222_00755 [Paenibacillus larvae subsp. pulvifaciens]AQZ48447.1 hypothetical protein B5S25_19510 [Paenibacillus larvae subsp. pulvifaciens]ARF70131.1 hypothetical protein B7C51_23220 [Paenibacillus larvae subsp. pulvifaciens]AVF22123.1 DNA-3-methyladenine glycosylase [Paenibacillus larvae subsp. larvae]
MDQTISLKVLETFTFDQTIGYLSRSESECMYHIEQDKIYKLISLPEEETLVEISTSMSCIK